MGDLLQHFCIWAFNYILYFEDQPIPVKGNRLKTTNTLLECVDKHFGNIFEVMEISGWIIGRIVWYLDRRYSHLCLPCKVGAYYRIYKSLSCNYAKYLLKESSTCRISNYLSIPFRFG